MPSPDITPHEIRYRIKNPHDFDCFRRKNIGEGISLLIACPKGHCSSGRCSVGTQTQAVRFDRDKFTPSEAKNWMKRHPKLGKYPKHKKR